MRFIKGMLTQKPETLEKEYPVYSASADIDKGALVSLGVTMGTDNGLVILSPADATGNIGIMGEDYDYSVEGSSVLGTSDVMKTILINPLALIEAEYNQAGVAATQNDTTTTITLTNLENNIDGAYLFAVDGNSQGNIRSLTASASGSCTILAKFTNDIASGDKFVKVLPTNHRLVVLTADRTQLSNTAAVGTAKMRVVGNTVVAPGIVGKAILRAGTHGQLDLGTGTISLYANLIALDNIFNPLS